MTTEHSVNPAPDRAASPQRSKSSLVSTLRVFAIWTLVFMVAVVTAFGAGYFLKERTMLDLRQRLVDQKAEAAARIAALEKQTLEAEKTQLERALERATLTVSLNDVLSPLPVALAEVERKNFGRAMDRIQAAKRALDGPGISAAVRDVASARLDAISNEIDRELGQLASVDMKQRIATKAEALERVLVARHDANPFLTATPDLTLPSAARAGQLWAAPAVDRRVLGMPGSTASAGPEPDQRLPLVTETVAEPTWFPAVPPVGHQASAPVDDDPPETVRPNPSAAPGELPLAGGDRSFGAALRTEPSVEPATVPESERSPAPMSPEPSPDADRPEIDPEAGIDPQPAPSPGERSTGIWTVTPDEPGEITAEPASDWESWRADRTEAVTGEPDAERAIEPSVVNPASTDPLLGWSGWWLVDEQRPTRDGSAQSSSTSERATPFDPSSPSSPSSDEWSPVRSVDPVPDVPIVSPRVLPGVPPG